MPGSSKIGCESYAHMSKLSEGCGFDRNGSGFQYRVSLKVKAHNNEAQQGSGFDQVLFCYF